MSWKNRILWSMMITWKVEFLFNSTSNGSRKYQVLSLCTREETFWRFSTFLRCCWGIVWSNTSGSITFFEKNFEGQWSFLWDHRTLFQNFGVISALGFKARVDCVACVRNWFVKYFWLCVTSILESWRYIRIVEISSRDYETLKSKNPVICMCHLW